MAVTLITGGSGFIGQAVVTALLERGGDTLRVLDLEPPPEPLAARVDFHQGSILDAQRLHRAMRGCERVFHLAGIPDLWLPEKRRFEEVNHQGSRRVLEAAARAGVRRLVFTSTESIVAGTRGRRGEVDETSPATLADMPGPYCRSKFRAEAAARQAARAGLPVVIVNPTLPVGAGDRRLTPPSRMLLGYLNGAYGAYLDTTVNLVHVQDVARGHLLAEEKGRPGERYLLSGENLRLRELLAMLERVTGLPIARPRVPWALAWGVAAVSEFAADHLTGRAPVAPLTGVRLARRPLCFTHRKARRELGLTFTPVREALVEAVADFRARGLLS